MPGACNGVSDHYIFTVKFLFQWIQIYSLVLFTLDLLCFVSLILYLCFPVYLFTFRYGFISILIIIVTYLFKIISNLNFHFFRLMVFILIFIFTFYIIHFGHVFPPSIPPQSFPFSYPSNLMFFISQKKEKEKKIKTDKNQARQKKERKKEKKKRNTSWTETQLYKLKGYQNLTCDSPKASKRVLVKLISAGNLVFLLFSSRDHTLGFTQGRCAHSTTELRLQALVESSHLPRVSHWIAQASPELLSSSPSLPPLYAALSCP